MPANVHGVNETHKLLREDTNAIRTVFYYKVGKPYNSEVISLAIEYIRFEMTASSGAVPAAALDRDHNKSPVFYALEERSQRAALK